MQAPVPHHRVDAEADQLIGGVVRYSPIKSLWFTSMLAGSLIAATLFFSWSGVTLFVLSTAFVLLFGHSLGSHRKFIHDSFSCPRWLEYCLVYFGTLVGLAGPIGLLRQHELRDFAQRLPDCHPYLRHGSGFVKDAWHQLHCELRFTSPPQINIESSRQSPFYRWLEATWMLQQLPIACIFFVLGGWSWVLWGVCARVTAGVFGHWLIGYFAHNHGAMNHHVMGAAVQGRNIPWTSLITMGESWHNNHHAYPGSARLGLNATEWDPGWWVLCIFARLGLVRDIVLPADLPPRPELRAHPPTIRHSVRGFFSL
ncbi:MAG: acyl-CoA desaturase [Burkholderiales bacterium]|nr:MAG: acyl-CoA desaturase [Burkholderiales bacterium]TAG77372.1 MAG: acyl-CoA desaturase [Betaproteobacteria bacterium]